MLQVKATNSSFLPYGNDEWRNLLDDVKELFRNGRYKECSNRCVASLEQVRGLAHPAHLTYISFYAALCITIQAQSLELRNPRKLVLLKLSLSFYERSEGFLMQATTEQNTSHDGPPKREYKRCDSNSSTRSQSLSVDSPTSTTHTTISSFPLPDNNSDDGFKSPSITTRGRTLSMDSTTSDFLARKDYKNLFYSTIKHSAATPPTPPLSPLEDSLLAKRELKRSGSSSSAHSKTSSIDSILDEFDFSLTWDANSRRSSASSYTSIASKPRPVPPPPPSQRTSPETAVEAISLFLLSQSRARYNAHIPEFYSRIKYHMTEVRKMIADVQFKNAALEAEGRPVRTLSIKELREGTGCAMGVQWKVDKEEVVKRVRRARVEALKRRGEERKPWDGGRYQELCKLALEELKR
ncbi:hypothetical protein VE04_00306 [Pseudogymnoascus sp. 24MN13]|nr:hypothetical protein VE04_00306 [Pseudogymnoascus sp. 24MN13]